MLKLKKTKNIELKNKIASGDITETDKILAIIPSDQKDKVTQMSTTINVNSATDVMSYGLSAQQDIADFADVILEQTKTGDLDNIGTSLNAIVLKSQSLDVSKLNKKSNFLSSIPFIGGLFDNVRQLKAQFETVADQIQKITVELESAKQQLIDRVAQLDVFYTKNTEQYQNLVNFIQAGNLKIHELKTDVLPALEAKYKTTQDPLEAQEINDLTQAISRFEKKLHDLSTVKTSALQTGPQIRIIQNGNQTLAENITSIVQTVIPNWKKQFILATALNEQKKAAELEKSIKDASNDIIQQNAALMHDTSIAIAESNERSVIDMESLEAVQLSLISTLDETKAIQEQGKKDRIVAAKRMEEMENEIKTRLANA